MHCIFITRCYRATNIPVIKQNLTTVFEGSKHTFEHIVIADLTRGMSFECAVEHLSDCVLQFATKKEPKDQYITKALDNTIRFLYAIRESSYVYILDDDNQITPDFLAALDACEDGDPDAVVFKVYGHPQWGDISILDHDAVGHIDWANMLIRLDVMKRLKVYTIGADSQKSDGLFFEKMKRDGCRIKFLNQICGRYNALPKP